MPHPPPGSSFRWFAWRLVRPVVRPIAWRLRTFFVGPLHDEVREMRAQVAALRAEVRDRAERDDAALEPRIASVIDQALLTLALDREVQRIVEPAIIPLPNPREER